MSGLRRDDDLWPFVRAEIGAAYRAVRTLVEDPPPGMWHALEERFHRGDADHGHRREWLRWSQERFEHEMAEELLDLVLYAAMRRVVHGGDGREW